jgi:hypothetical protein
MMDFFLNDWWFEFFSYMAACWLALLVWGRISIAMKSWWIVEKQAILKPYEIEPEEAEQTKLHYKRVSTKG